MGFWIFMLAMELLIPAIMIVLGNLYVRHAPEEINPLNGYRTKRSMINQDTWDFANRHFVRTLCAAGWAVLVLSLLAMLPVRGKSETVVSNFGLILIGAQVVILVLCIVPTERALRKTFDGNGGRKK